MPNEITIITNNTPRNVLFWHDLSEKERKEFNYLDTEEKQYETTFIRYRGWVYDLGDCENINPRDVPVDRPFKGWHAKVSDSYFSGVLFKFPDSEFETVICGRYYC